MMVLPAQVLQGCLNHEKLARRWSKVRSNCSSEIAWMLSLTCCSAALLTRTSRRPSSRTVCCTAWRQNCSSPTSPAMGERRPLLHPGGWPQRPRAPQVHNGHVGAPWQGWPPPLRCRCRPRDEATYPPLAAAPVLYTLTPAGASWAPGDRLALLMLLGSCFSSRLLTRFLLPLRR